MKRLSLIIVGMLIVLMVSGQDQYPIDFIRNKIMTKLMFIYVDQPNLPRTNRNASTVLSNADIANNENLTGNFWTNTNNRGSQSLVRKLLQAPQSREDSLFQYIVGTVLRIQDKKVKVYLFNDWNNSSLTSYHASWGITPSLFGDNSQLNSASTSPWVWPHALHRQRGQFTGYISMGSAFLSDFISGQDAGISTIIHELVHTQDNAESTRIFNTLAYGRDGGHSERELLSNFYVAYTEGIANAFEMRYSTGSHVNLFNTLNNNGQLYYEVLQAATCSIIPRNCCIDRYLNTTHNVAPASTRTIGSGAGSYTEQWYRIQSLPSDVLIHNEAVQNYIFFNFINYFSAQDLAFILRAARSRTRGRFGFPIILEEMVKSSVERSTSRGQINNSRYFPIALLDFFTGFKLTSEDILNQCLRTRNTERWSDDISGYWQSQQRGAIINKFQNDYSRRFTVRLLHDIAEHFHIN